MQKKRGKWVLRTYRAGNVIERSKVYLPNCKGQIRRHRVKGSTTASKKDRNANAAVRTLARLINCNFDHRDIYLTLSFDDEHYPEDRAAMQKETDNFCRRLTRAMVKSGAHDIKRVIVLSDKDGKTGAAVRPHVHIVITGASWTFRDGGWYIGEKAVSNIWGRGKAYAEPLRRQDDYTPLAVYLIKQASSDDNAKKYTCSHNLVKPIITEEEVATDRQVTAPKGAVICENRYDTIAGENYIRYIAPKKESVNARNRR